MKHIIDKLDRDGILNIEELKELLSNCCEEDREYLFEKAREKSRSFYGNRYILEVLLSLLIIADVIAITVELELVTQRLIGTGSPRRKF